MNTVINLQIATQIILKPHVNNHHLTTCFWYQNIRVSRSEIFFLNIFFMVFSIISVTTDAILAAARNHPEKIGSHGQSR
jgi:hypothetical protein